MAVVGEISRVGTRNVMVITCSSAESYCTIEYIIMRVEHFGVFFVMTDVLAQDEILLFSAPRKDCLPVPVCLSVSFPSPSLVSACIDGNQAAIRKSAVLVLFVCCVLSSYPLWTPPTRSGI